MLNQRERATDASACMRRPQAFALELVPVLTQVVRVYVEAPGFRPGTGTSVHPGCPQRFSACS